MDIRKIALYLSGKLPPEYSKYNRLEFMGYLEDIFGLNLEKIDFYWKQAKEYEEEFYFLVLDLLNRKAEKDENEQIKLESLFLKLQLPDETQKNRWTPKNKSEFDKILEGFTEIPATEEIIAPILNQIFPLASPRGHEFKAGEWGNDFHIIAYSSPLGTKYLGIQVKQGGIKQTELVDICNQLTTGMKVAKYASDGTLSHPNEMILVSTGKIHDDLRRELINTWEYKNNKLIIWDRDELYQLVLKYGLPHEPVPRKK